MSGVNSSVPKRATAVSARACTYTGAKNRQSGVHLVRDRGPLQFEARPPTMAVRSSQVPAKPKVRDQLRFSAVKGKSRGSLVAAAVPSLIGNTMFRRWPGESELLTLELSWLSMRGQSLLITNFLNVNLPVERCPRYSEVPRSKR